MPIAVTGYALRDALKQWELRLAAANKSFNGSLYRFKGEENKKSPHDVALDISTAERAIVELQVAQMQYNLLVGVNVQGESMTLAEAIKHVGSAGKIEKMWKAAVTGKEKSKYSYEDPTVRDNNPNQERAVEVLSSEELLAVTGLASRRAGALRSVIATANATSQMVDLDPTLLIE